MIVVELKGGLGNQMFQYSIGRALSLNFSTDLYLDTSFLTKNSVSSLELTARNYELDVFTIRANLASADLVNSFKNDGLVNKFLRKLGLPSKNTLTEPSLAYHKAFERSRPPLYLVGYWQSERYFFEFEDKIREDFTFSSPLDSLSKTISSTITRDDKSIGIHFRRGDFISSTLANKFHGVCSINYYNEAIQILDEKVDNANYYVFSDQPEWVQENFVMGRPRMTLVGHNSGDDSWKDMYLMSLCKHNIIANSTFSWWAAWLNKNPEKIIIAPKKWFADTSKISSDLIPTKWIQL